MQMLQTMLVAAVVFAAVVCGAQGAGPVYHTFAQRVDHFDNTNTATFGQRYTVNASAYQPGGPILFFLSGEAPMQFFEFQEVQAVNWATEHNGMFVVLEHRFYGDSSPAGAANYSTPALRLLSSEQALADAAYFRTAFNNDLVAAGKKPGPWVVIGCSYSAGLAAWFRARHPELVVGAISPSGPVNATLDQSNFLALFDKVAPEQCVVDVKTAVAAIEAELKRGPPGLAALSTAFDACEPIDDVNWFVWNVALAVGTADQFANPVPENTLQAACATLAAASDKVAAVADIVKTSGNIYTGTRASSDSCVHLSKSYFLKDMQREDNPNRSWWWQKATEFSYLKTTTESIFFPSFPVTLADLLPLFGDIFGIPGLTPQVEWTNTNYGGFNLIADNVIFTNGLIDPWHLLSITADVPPPSGVKAVTYTGGHCATLNARSPADPPSLTAARVAVEAELAQWLADARN